MEVDERQDLGTYGARRVHAELTLGQGVIVRHGAMELLMRRAGIKGLPGSRRPRPKHRTPTAGDLVHRQFAHPPVGHFVSVSAPRIGHFGRKKGRK